MVGPVHGKAEPRRRADRRQTLLLCLHSAAVFVTHTLDAGNRRIALALQAAEADPAAIWQVGLGRVERLQSVAADRGRRQPTDGCLDLVERRKEVPEQHQPCVPRQRHPRRQPGIVLVRCPSAPRPVCPGRHGRRSAGASGAIIVTRSPPRNSSDASASSSNPARSCFSTDAPRERQRIDAEASRHTQMVCAASHSVSRMNQPSGTGRPDFADCRQWIRAIGSPATKWRNCQKLSP